MQSILKFHEQDMLENLQSMNLRSNATSPASVVGTPPRHPGSATAELPRRVIYLFLKNLIEKINPLLTST